MGKDHVVDALEEILAKAKGYQFEPLKNKLKAKAVVVTSGDEGEEQVEEGLESLESDEGEEYEEQGEEEDSSEFLGKEKGAGEDDEMDDELKSRLLEMLSK